MRTCIRSSGIFTSLFALIATSSSAHAWVPNGIEIPASEFPGVVSLHMDDQKGSFFCSGSMIAQGTILTAAHCAQVLVAYTQARTEAVEKAVASGNLPLAQSIANTPGPTVRSGNRTWGIDALVIHPDAIRMPITSGKTRLNGFRCPDGFTATPGAFNDIYCINSRNDVALLISSSAIKSPSSGFPRSSYLKFSETSPKIGSPITMVGFGANDLYVPDPAKFIAGFLPGSLAKYFSNGGGTKRKGFNEIVDLEDELIFVTGLTQDKGPFYAPKPDGKNATVGPGDSGGPLLMNGKIIGVTSYIRAIRDNDEETSDSAFVRTDRKEIRDFIYDSMVKIHQTILHPQPETVLRVTSQ